MVEVLWEDEWIIAIEKPSGMLSVPGKNEECCSKIGKKRTRNEEWVENAKTWAIEFSQIDDCKRHWISAVEKLLKFDSLPRKKDIFLRQLKRNFDSLPLAECSEIWDLLTEFDSSRASSVSQDRVSALDHMKRKFGSIFSVHRLDQDTSGVLIFAKASTVCESLNAQFREKKMKKTYLALVEGKLESSNNQMTISLPISKDPEHSLLQKVDLENGKEATTDVIIIQSWTYQNKPITLVALRPRTGRTHQLRVHLSAIGCPIVGDSFYGSDSIKTISDATCIHSKRTNDDIIANFITSSSVFNEDDHFDPYQSMIPMISIPSRLCLHAYRLEFIHPITQLPIHIECACPFLSSKNTE